MYLSCLLIDVGVNPDRPRPGRLWLRNLYRVHQRLCMAFPDDNRTESDPEFLAPFRSKDFPLTGARVEARSDGKQVHVARAEKKGFLFRVDSRPEGSPVILVQSACAPDWDYAFSNARHLLCAPPQINPSYNPGFSIGQHLRFRLRANATRRATRTSRGANGQALDARWIGRRIPVPATEVGLRTWLESRACKSGFKLTELRCADPAYFNISKPGDGGNGHKVRLFSVLYDGTMEVTDSDALERALVSGIGPGKAFGFGLLSLAPA